MPITDLPGVNLGSLGGGYSINAGYDPLFGVTFIQNNVGNTTLCAIHPSTRMVRACWMQESNLANIAAWVDQYNTKGFNTYFTLNLPKPGLKKKPSKDEIAELRGVAGDNDAKAGRSLDEAFATIGRMGIPPSFITATGGGFQPIWMFSEPLPATDRNAQLVEAVGARIVQLMGSDPVQNIDRILRIPFTKNFPTATKAAAGRIVCCSGLVIPNIGENDGQTDIGMGNLE